MLPCSTVETVTENTGPCMIVRNVQCWKMLPCSTVETVAENTGPCMIVICKVQLCVVC
jgi:hypothetical protein